MSIQLRAVLRMLLSFAVIYLLVFTLGGNPRWPQGWAWFGILAATVILNLIVMRDNPELLRERMGPIYRRGQGGTDRLLLSVFLVFYTGWFVLMPLDAQRYHWSPQFPLWLNVAGALLMATGSGILAACFHQNAYLSTVVRVQHERGHAVVDSGPYAIVRHPMYFGILCLLLGGAVLLGSIWGTVCAVLGSTVLYIRSINEERVLAEELPGYREYMQKVRHRLIPGLF